MMVKKQDVDELVAALNPVPIETGLVHSLDERARADLRVILESSPTVDRGVLSTGHPSAGHPSAVRRLRWALPAAAILAVMFVIAPAIGHRLGMGNAAYAATPGQLRFEPVTSGLDATTLLRQIADRTAGLADDTGSGRYSHVTIRSWDLFTRIEGQQVTSAVVPQERDTWLDAEGSGRTVVTATMPGNHRIHTDMTVKAGGLALMWPLRSLSSEDAALARQLQTGHPVGNGPAEQLVAVNDAYLQMPIPPTVRAAMLRYLATIPGLEVVGRTTDRAGRVGLGFSLDSDAGGLPGRSTVIIDPNNGRLLDTEEMLTTTAGKLNVPIPSVIGYTVFLSAGYTDTTG